MIYMGSKARLKKHILPYIQECIDGNGISLYVEPFVGGANVIDSVRCARRFGCDANTELIHLLRYMRDNPAMEAAPKEVTFEHYKEVRQARKDRTMRYSIPYTAMVGYFASYAGRYFDGGYGRDAKGERSMYKERLAYARKQAPALKGIQFCKQDYREVLSSSRMSERPFVYCDPPYRGTKQYGAVKGIDYDEYYGLLGGIKDTAFVLCSEFEMPEDRFVCIWDKERSVLLVSDREEGNKAIERLYTPRGGLYHKWWETWYENKGKDVHQRERHE